MLVSNQSKYSYYLSIFLSFFLFLTFIFFFFSLVTELSLIHSSLWKILNFVGDSYISWGVKAQIYILILRFLITSINKGENFATSSVTALSIQFLIKEFVDNKPGSRKTSTLDNSFNDEDDHGYNDLSREDLSEDTLESSIQQSILMDQLHLSIETFRFIFSCLEETLYYYYNNSLESCSPRIPYSSNYTELIISAQLLQNNSIDKILEIAYQTTAWVRSLILTNDNRRRAIYHGIAEVTLSTLRICCSIRLTNDNSNNNSSKVQSLIAQLLSLIRNIVNDKSGRDRFNDPNPAFFKKTRLSNSLNIISCLCLLLYRYKTHPVVVMSVVRVLAVMSQFEVFRTLIRASSSYLSEIVSQPSSSRTYDELNGIIGVIKYEADICKSIMEDNDENCEVTEWPSWYTWPVISRACYTLGNITMMNAKIRKVIGIKLDITSSLVLLLQVSANSLLRIHQQNQEKISLKNGNSIFTVVNKGNEVYNIGGVDTIFSFLARHVTENNRIHSLRKEEEESKKGSRRGDHDGNSSDYEIDDTSEMELRDAVIKLIRLLSNLSIDEQIGASVGVRQDLIQSLYELLLIAQNNNLPITTSNEYQYEELQLNIIAALTNLTFYTCQALNNKEDLVIKQQKEQQTKVVSKTLIRFDRLLTRLSVSLIDSIFHSNNEIVLEATRVLGNLTRRVAPIEALISRRVDEALLMISQVMINKLKASNPSNSFQSEDPSTIEYEIAQSCIGILVNFSALSDGRYKILSFPAPGSVRSLSIFEELLRFLKILSPFYHVSLAVLITQVIYNIISSLEFRKNYIKNYSEKISTPSLISAFYEDLPDNIKNIPNTLNEWVELGEEDLEGNINTSSEYKQLVQVSQAIDKLF